jgi:uncharacterized protein
MIERDAYPPGVPCWVDTGQPDPGAAASFYGGLLGWEFRDRMPPGASGTYLVATLRGRDVAAVGSQMPGMPPTPFWTTYVAVDDADAAAARAADAGGAVLAEPFDVGDAGRMAVLADPEGAVFCVWQAGTAIGAQLVNEPGTWNFSELNVRDPEAAQRFYGAVFGWEVAGLEGMEGGAMWRLPGYGDFLEKRDPELRSRMAELGAPEGFEDVVAMLIPARDEGAPAHWSVTFAVDDADAVAARATELGGTVLEPPMDAPWVRMTVLQDPQGAVFTASKFVPPV